MGLDTPHTGKLAPVLLSVDTSFSGICPKHFYLVAVQRYVGSINSDVVYIVGNYKLPLG